MSQPRGCAHDDEQCCTPTAITCNVMLIDGGYRDSSFAVAAATVVAELTVIWLHTLAWGVPLT